MKMNKNKQNKLGCVGFIVGALVFGIFAFIAWLGRECIFGGVQI